MLAFQLHAAPEMSTREFARKVAERETQTEKARANYMYRQSVAIQEITERGVMAGEYHEVREIIFSPIGERFEKMQGSPRNTLKGLRLTETDFRDIREIQPMLLTTDALWNYDIKRKGTEKIDICECEVLEIRPRQILQGQHLFEGLLWVDPSDYSIVRSEGQPVPQMRSSSKEENLFPHFTTVRAKTEGFWFPVQTFADDTLYFRTGPQRIRMTIRYSDYRRFGAESKVTSAEEK